MVWCCGTVEISDSGYSGFLRYLYSTRTGSRIFWVMRLFVGRLPVLTAGISRGRRGCALCLPVLEDSRGRIALGYPHGVAIGERMTSSCPATPLISIYDTKKPRLKIA